MDTRYNAPVELTDAELDAVAAGQAGAGGLVAVAVDNVLNNSLDNISILNNNKVSILDNSLNGNKTNVGAGVLINLLGGPAAIRGSQTTP
jgi:hypothetical protein